jgi:hypothetical protein
MLALMSCDLKLLKLGFSPLFWWQNAARPPSNGWYSPRTEGEQERERERERERNTHTHTHRNMCICMSDDTLLEL